MRLFARLFQLLASGCLVPMSTTTALIGALRAEEGLTDTVPQNSTYN